jgi:hypothetical protein
MRHSPRHSHSQDHHTRAPCTTKFGAARSFAAYFMPRRCAPASTSAGFGDDWVGIPSEGRFCGSTSRSPAAVLSSANWTGVTVPDLLRRTRTRRSGIPIRGLYLAAASSPLNLSPEYVGGEQRPYKHPFPLFWSSFFSRCQSPAERCLCG